MNTLQIDWMQEWGNNPIPTLTVAQELYDFFSFDTPEWEQLPNGMCLLTHPISQLTRYIYIHPDPAQRESTSLYRGFGGARFTLKMRDGTTITTNNAWSGNAGNLYRDGYGNHVYTDVDVKFGDDNTTFSGFAVPTEFLRDLVEAQGYYLLDSTHPGAHFPTISASPDELTKAPTEEAA